MNANDEFRLPEGAFLWRMDGPWCKSESSRGYLCSRGPEHSGRHAFVHMSGVVREVWGEDVHAERRVTSRVTAAFREIPQILRIETARTWDGVAR